MTERLLAILCVLAGVLPGQQRGVSERRVREHARSVRFVYELRNRGDAPLRDVELRLVLPPELPRQRIDLLRVGNGGIVRKDGYGNRVAVFRTRTLAPRGTFVGQWFATVRLRHTRVRPGKVKPLSPEQRALYLEDREAYSICDPLIVKLAEEAVAGLEHPLDKIETLHDVVVDRMRYERDGRWDPAPACLRRGAGSCSEYTYSFIALCRAARIPARWAGSTALRSSDPGAYEDRVFHRWAEVWLDDRGWFPVDCSRNDGEDQDGPSARRWFGSLPWQLLVLARGDGGESCMTGWAYHASGRWKGRGARSRRRGYWTEAVGARAFDALARRAGEPAEPAAAGPRQAWLFLSDRGVAPPARR